MTLSCAAPGSGSPVGLGTYGCGYTEPGTYTVVVTANDAMGVVIYSKSNTVVVRSAQQHLAGVKAVYTDLIDRLKAGNKAGALKLLVSHAQVLYDQIFTALGSNLASAAAQLGDLEATTAGTKSAEYVVIRTVNGVDRAFFLYAIRAEDGIWRLESM